MKVFRAALVLALLADPVYAQMPNINLMPEAKTRTPEQIEQDNIADKAYRESLRKIPDSKSGDPWGGVRSPDAPKPAAAKPRVKSGSAAN